MLPAWVTLEWETAVARRRIDLTELAERVRRQGLLGALVEPPRPAAPPRRLEQPPAPRSQPPAEPEVPDTIEFEIDPQVVERLRACTLACGAVVTGVADLPAIELSGRVFEVGLIRMRVRRPEGDWECCVRQHIPGEIRGLVGPGAGVMALAHENERNVAIVDWAATGEWIGAKLSFPSADEQYEWPEREEWPGLGEIEIHDVNGHREELDQRRGGWSLGSADLLSLSPLRSRVDQRDEWRISLELRDGRTLAITERVPLLALARLRPGNEDRVRTQIDVLISPEGGVAVDWESTLRQPELRAPRPLPVEPGGAP
ncbi:MAG: hypothetical protein QOD71_1347 [Thermoleophilaceae bacterium]|jgi:hypothetical protein|nr:hypothetical protein [Thermoleophilaceae bacterium]